MMPPSQPTSLTGIPIYGSPFVPRGEIVRLDDPIVGGGPRIYYHRHLSVTGRKKRGHGRPRNAPRRWKMEQRFVDYGLLERLLGGSR